MPCPRKVVSLINATIPGNPDAILTAEVSASLGLTPWPRAEGEDHTPDGAGWDDSGWRDLVESDLRERDDGGGGRLGPFDLSVLCTAVSDVNHLLKDTYPVDPRLVDALLWSVKVRLVSGHSVRAYRAEKGRGFCLALRPTDAPAYFCLMFAAKVRNQPRMLQLQQRKPDSNASRCMVCMSRTAITPHKGPIFPGFVAVQAGRERSVLPILEAPVATFF